MDYLPYGEERINEHTPPADGATPFDTKKKYTGKELDTETGLYYYGARYYDSRISRFISLDPAGINLSDIRSFTNPQGWNMYSYALNNPVRYNDPSGKVPDPTDAIALACGPAAPGCLIAKEMVETAAFLLGVWVWENVKGEVANTTSPTNSEVSEDSAAASSDAVPYGPPDITASAPQPYGPPDPSKNKKDGNLNKNDVPENVRKQIPKEWGEGEPAREGGEWRWKNPKNPSETVRYSEAKPDSQYSSQQKPYVKQTGPNGQPVDINGKRVPTGPGGKPSKAPESHIPADRWQFRR